MKVKFTPDQENAIKAKGTVLVSAAAGSGKTAVLTERVVKKICDEKAKVKADRLLIVTFTKASALEMRIRITSRLDEIIAEHPYNQYYHRQKLLLQNAKICTIDTFCMDLVKKNFSLLGISPNFEVADQAKADSLAEKVIDRVLLSYYQNPSDSFNELSAMFGTEQSESNLKNTVKKIYDVCMCMSDPDGWLKMAADSYNCDELKGSYHAQTVFKFVDRLLSSAEDTAALAIREIEGTELEQKLLPWFLEREDNLRNLREAVKDNNWDEARYISYNCFNSNKPTVKPKTALSETVTGMHEKIKEVLKKVKGMFDLSEADVKALMKKTYPMVKTFCDIVSAFSDAFFDELSSLGMLTFSQIEQLALKLLCDKKDGEIVPSQLSAEISREYDEVMVDEYQDNNDLQDALFFAVSDSGKHLFMVGDVKQSIYGFRGANPDNFLKHKNALPDYEDNSDKSKVMLKANFRSSSSICKFVNAVCAPIMTEETCGMNYGSGEMLDPKANFPESSEPDVTLMLSDIAEGEYKREEADAVAVADKIEEIMSKQPFLVDKNGNIRATEYGDFAILMRSVTGPGKYYSDELKRRGIPVSYDPGGFFESAEIKTAVSLLKVIDNPSRDIPLLAVMTSNIYAFSPDELADIRVSYGKRSLYSAVCAAAEDGNIKCADMLSSISSYRADAATLSVGRLLDKIYKSTALPEIFSAMPYGKKRSDNLYKLARLADSMTKNSGGGLSRFLSELDRMDDAKPSDGPNSLANAVEIMSFHGSKGLQFPICIIANMGKKFNDTDRKNTFIYNYKSGIGADNIDISSGTKAGTVVKEAVKIAETEKMAAEEIRLLYVAMTRAEQKLIISVTEKDVAKRIIDTVKKLGMSEDGNKTVPSGAVISAKGSAEWLYMALLMQASSQPLAKFAGVVPFGTDKTADYLLSVRYFNEKHDKTAVNNCTAAVNTDSDRETVKKYEDAFKERFSYKYPFEQECNIPAKMAVTELVHGDKDTFSFSARPEFMSKNGLTPAERGTAVHKFMQFADYKAAKEDAVAEIARLEEWEFLSSNEAAVIDTGDISAFFNSDIYSRMLRAKDVKREYKFMIDYPYNDSTTIVQGIADCLIFEEDGIVILDFKTDAVKEVSELKEYYSGQLEVYKYAMERIFGQMVKECVLYSIGLHKYIAF